MCNLVPRVLSEKVISRGRDRTLGTRLIHRALPSSKKEVLVV